MSAKGHIVLLIIIQQNLSPRVLFVNFIVQEKETSS